MSNIKILSQTRKAWEIVFFCINPLTKGDAICIINYVVCRYYKNTIYSVYRKVNDMKICGLQKLTLLDFPTKTACTVFTGGCNLRCPFCHNASLVTGVAEAMDVEEFYSFLKKRKGLLQGVCVSGGEPLLQKELPSFIKRIKDMDFAVKLDTNGTMPQKLSELITAGLTDYVAMDLKNSPEKYGETVGVKGFDFKTVAESMDILRGSGISYEYRTTVVKPLHTLQSLEELASLIKPDEVWYLQQYTDSGELINPTGLTPYTDDEMRNIVDFLRKNTPSVRLRGL